VASGAEPDPQPPPDRDERSGALFGLIFALALVLGGLLLWHILHRVSALQDCVMSGRTNCAPIDSPDNR
jgi:hypothetical protein